MAKGHQLHDQGKYLEASEILNKLVPAISHLQYRLVESGDGTTLQFLHRAIGELDPEHCARVETGWDYQLQQIKHRSES